MPIECKCINCGKIFYTKPSKVTKWCSKECYNNSRPKIYKDREKFCTCKICGKEFLIQRDLKTGSYKKVNCCSDECRKIALNTTKNKEKLKSEFIDIAIKKHGNKFSYNRVNYYNRLKKVIIHCNEHDCDFETTPQLHLRQRSGGCPECIKKERLKIVREKTKSKEYYVQRAKTLFEDLYDYSDFEYKNWHTKGKILCKKHNTYFMMTFHVHLQGRGCPLCAKEKRKISCLSNSEEFINKAINIHKNRYDYSKVDYKGATQEVIIKCNICNNEFLQSPHSHLKGCGCPFCNRSKGELKVENWLAEHNIKFVIEKRFDDCRDKKPLPFDFYLPDYNTCIEFQGEQHFNENFRINNSKERLQLQKIHDKIKKEYCKSKNINFIEIRYIKNIEKILNEWLNDYFSLYKL